MTSHETLLKIMDVLDDHVAIVDLNGTIQMMNLSFYRYLEQHHIDPLQEDPGVNYFDLIKQWAEPGVYGGLQRIVTGKASSYSSALPCLSPAKDHWFSLKAYAYKLDGETGIVAIHKDKSDYYRATHYDSTTALPNRQKFIQTLSEQMIQAVLTKTALSVLIVDLDDFKEVNCALGYEKGNELLQEIARRAQKIGHGEPYVAKLEGDRFALLFARCRNDKELDTYIRAVREVFATPFETDDGPVEIRASIGISRYSGQSGSEDADALLRSADIALHRAKSQGNSQVCIYSPDLDADTFKTFKLKSDLLRAIQKDELLVFFQPRVEADSYKLTGAEALVRWRHPEWGIVNPHEFIHLYEEAGLISAMGEKVFDLVCDHVKRWEKSGHSCKIFVNVSQHQLSNPNFVRMMASVLAKYELPADRFELEITDELPIHSEPIREALQSLHQIGFTLALDDFGTGFSSLAQLKTFQIDTIKIDRSLVQEMTEDDYCAEVIHSIAELGQRLDLKVVAEGIVNPQQLRLLEKFKCDEYQGFLFSEPVDPERFARQFLRRGYCYPQTNDRNYENEREYFRVYFPYFVEAKMTIVQVDDQTIHVGKTPILIADMSAGGIKFLSVIRMPIKKEVILGVEIPFYNSVYKLQGRIVWSKEEGGELMSYGLEFLMEEDQRAALVQMLNKVKIDLRKSDSLPGFSIVSINEHLYFKNVKSS